jgi:hypothetical protein
MQHHFLQDVAIFCHLSDLLEERNLVEQTTVDVSQHSESELRGQLVEDQALT